MPPRISSNLKAQRKWLASKENVFNLHRSRALKRIAKGASVSVNTLDKYNISDVEFNKIRKENNLDPIKLYRPKVASTQALVAKVNRAKFYAKAIEEEQQLANKIRTEEATLKELHGTIQDQNAPRTAAKSSAKVQVLTVDSKLSFSAVREYFKSIVGTPKFNIATFEGYFGKRIGTGLFSNVMKIIGCDPTDDIVHCLKNPDHIISKINAKRVKAGTKMKYYSVLWVVLNRYPLLKTTFKLEEVSEILDKEYQKHKAINDAEYLIAQDKDSVDPFSEIKAKIEKAFPRDSQEYLFINLYAEVSARDNFGDLQIIFNKKELEIQPGDDNYGDQDYLYWDEDGMTVYIQRYKTFDLYGVLKVDLSEDLYHMIHESYRRHPRHYLFIQNSIFKKLKPRSKPVGPEALYAGGALSSFVGDMLKKAGVKKEQTNAEGGKHNAGSINLLRHSKISEYERNHPNMTAEDRARLALEFKHSPITSQKYVRKLGIDKLSTSELKRRSAQDA